MKVNTYVFAKAKRDSDIHEATWGKLSAFHSPPLTRAGVFKMEALSKVSLGKFCFR